MNRLLIVDDEHHIVNWLAELFEEQKDLELEIYRCYSGLEALKLLENQKIDVILLDIKMPGLSGLEVADRVLPNWPACRIIFLTGHSNFEYIYKADKYKNATYLLKTEDDEGIISAVAKALESIRSELMNIEYLNSAKQKEKLLKHLMQKDYLKDIILGNSLTSLIDAKPWYSNDSGINISRPVYLLYMKVKWKPVSNYSVEYNDNLLQLIQCMESLLYEKFEYALLDMNPSTMIWFFQPKENHIPMNQQTHLVYLKNMTDEMCSFCHTKNSMNAILVLYDKAVPWEQVQNTVTLLSRYYTEKIPQSVNLNTLAVIVGEKEEQALLANHTAEISCHSMNKELQELSLYLYQEEQEEFMKTLRKISAYCAHEKSMHNLPSIEIYFSISLMLMGYIDQYRLEKKLSMKTGLYPLYYIHDFVSWEIAFQYIEKLSRHIFELVKDKEVDKTKKIINTIKNYIKTHLDADLTLTHIAEQVNYNASYISRLFKQITGSSLTEYITLSRIEEAKELLLNSNLSIQNIADRTGFDTTQYFSIVFKKAVGISPREFQNRT